jgi:hypothetical protein
MNSSRDIYNTSPHSRGGFWNARESANKGLNGVGEEARRSGSVRGEVDVVGIIFVRGLVAVRIPAEIGGASRSLGGGQCTGVAAA